MKTKAVLTNIALILLGLVLAVGVAEAAARVILPRRDPKAIFDRQLGWTPPHGRRIRYEDVGFATSTYFNSAGLRGAEIPPSSPARPRVLVLGDSMVEGIQVADSELITARMRIFLEQRGFDSDVLNAGVAGYGTVQEFLYAGRLIPRLRPQVVILLVTVYNDLTDNTDPFGGRRPYAVVRGDGSVEILPLNVSPLSLSARSVLSHFRVAYALREGISRIPFLSRFAARMDLAQAQPDVSHFREVQGLTILEALLVQMRDLAVREGVECFVVGVIPDSRSVQAPPAERVLRKAWVHASIQRTCEQERIECLDLYAPLRQAYLRTGRELYSEAFNWHWTTAGHEVAANTIVSYLLDHCSRFGRVLH